jgi:transposase
MIWAAIWDDEHSEIIVMNRDRESRWQGYSANSYIKVLDDNLYFIWELGLQVMQDNIKIHSSRKVKTWFENNAIPVIDWPPYSPDLDLIKNAWSKLKERIYKIEPGIEYLTNTDEKVKIVFPRAIQRAWKNLNQE